MVPSTGLVEQLREIKDKDEIGEIRQAIRLAERVFTMLRAGLRPDRRNARSPANWNTRSAGWGARAALSRRLSPSARVPPCHTPCRRISAIAADPLLLVDWGAKAHLYMSDLTRILVTGRISPKLERIYGVVLKAQEQAIAAIRPGCLMCDVDAAARDVIAKAGLRQAVRPRAGARIRAGNPRSPRLAADKNRPLKAGMVITVEPGIYLPGWGGVRIEDDVLVTRTGHEVLSGLPKELADCVVD